MSGESLISYFANWGVLGCGFYMSSVSWEAKVKLRKARESKRMEIHELQSAVLLQYESLSNQKGDWVDHDGDEWHSIRQTSAHETQRRLTSDECQLLLLIDKKNHTYHLKGELRVEGISERSYDNTEIVYKGHSSGPRSDSDEVKDVLHKKINIKCDFGERIPRRIDGKVDEIANLPQWFRNLGSAMVGELKEVVSFQLGRPRGQHR